MGETVDYVALHKKAFRVAFDYLMKNWPPEHSVEYFDRVYAEARELAKGELDGNPLGQKMVAEIYWYLSDMVKVVQSDGAPGC